MLDEDGLDFIGALSVVAARTTTPAGLVRRLAERVAESLLLVALELGTGDSSGFRARRRDGWEAKPLDRPEPSRRGRAARSCVRCAFEPPGSGYLALELDGPEPPAALVRAITRVAEAGIVHCRQLERVARSARGAHEDGRRLRRALEDASAPIDVVASSPAMHALLAQLDAVAAHDTTVLLTGETGTGKEVLARRVHRLSGRAGEFIKLNCGALPPGLVESELFGHEPGAFTGATRVHRGRFERADGGTLLLDEVGELPLAAQVKLLRTLQEHEVERVGGERTIPLDVRVIAATHRDLGAMVADGRFREDLYYRLSVIAFAVPPLRHRSADILPLAHAVVRGLAERQGVPAPMFDAAAESALVHHPWPGNVRQLANALERAMILCPADPGRELVAHLGTRVATSPSAPAVDARSGSLGELTAALARERIRDALRSCGGRVYGERGAARALGLKPSTLQDKVRRLGLSADLARARK